MGVIGYKVVKEYKEVSNWLIPVFNTEFPGLYLLNFASLLYFNTGRHETTQTVTDVDLVEGN